MKKVPFHGRTVGIKKGVGAGRKRGLVAPNGDVWTGTPAGSGENHGNYNDYLP